MKARITFFALLAIGIGLACSPATTTPAVPIPIGLILSQTGSNANAGTSQTEGAVLAVEEINDAGGVLGRPLELLLRDNASDAVKAADLANVLADAGVQAILGSNPSAATVAMIKAVAPQKVVVISGASITSSLTTLADDGFGFRTCPSEIAQQQVMAKRVFSKGITKVALLHGPVSPNPTTATAFATAFTALGGTITLKTQFAEGQASYVNELTATYATSPEAISFYGRIPDVAQFMKDYISTFSAKGTTFFFNSSLAQADFIAALGASNFATFQHEGISSTTAAKNDRYPIFKAAFKARYGRDTNDNGVVNTYDSVYVLALAIQAAGRVDGTAIRDQLIPVSKDGGTYGPAQFRQAIAALKADGGADIDYAGVSGDVDFDSNGDIVTGGFDIWKVVNGAITNIETDVQP